MPDVRMPDGTIIRNVPEGTTKAQLMARLGKHAEPAISGGSWLDKGLSAVSHGVSAANEALIGLPEGMYNAAAAITDPVAKEVISLIRGPEAADEAISRANAGRRAVSDTVSHAIVKRPNPVARDAGRVGGALALPLPGKKLQEGGRLARAAYRAAQGAVGGAAVRDVDEDAAAPAAVGAVANVVLPPILSTALRPLKAAARPITNYLFGSADDAAAVASSRPLAPLGRKAEARAARFKAAGVDKPTTGMVTREPNTFSFERNTAPVQGVGDDLAMQIRDVEEGLVKHGRKLVDKAGGARGAEATGKAVQEALDAKRGEMQQVTSRLYDKVRDERGDDPVGSLDSLRGLLDHPDMTDNAVFDGMRDSLSRRMARLGIIGQDGSPIEGGAATVKQAEELRKFIRGLGSTIDPTVRMMRGKLIDALDDDVVGAIGDDAFKAARASAKARFDEFGKTFAGKIADEGVAPERLTKRVLSDSTSLADLRAMRESLLGGTEEQAARGKEAWQGLRAQALDDLLSKSSNEEGKLLGGQLAKDFVKQSAKLRELLDPRDYVELRRLVLASRDATVAPPGSSVNHSGSAITLANMFQNTRPGVKKGWLEFLAKNGMSHIAAWSVAGPSGNLGLWFAKSALDRGIETKAANELARRVQLAGDPKAAAAAVQQLRDMAKSNPVAADHLQKLGIPVGAVAAEATK